MFFLSKKECIVNFFIFDIVHFWQFLSKPCLPDARTFNLFWDKNVNLFKGLLHIQTWKLHFYDTKNVEGFKCIIAMDHTKGFKKNIVDYLLKLL